MYPSLYIYTNPDTISHALTTSAIYSDPSSNINNFINVNTNSSTIAPCNDIRNIILIKKPTNNDRVRKRKTKIHRILLPSLSKQEAFHVLKRMYEKDAGTLNDRTPLMMENHPDLTPGMRSIVVDWLMQVCEELKLLRETYYLAVDFFDRYLSVTKMISITTLQLIGIASLFVAAKVEEVHPPKLSTLVNISDDGYTEDDILRQELLILHHLNWRTADRVTVIGWLGVYMQLSVSHRTPLVSQLCNNKILNTRNNKGISSYVAQAFPRGAFEQVSQLTDLCSLDINMANFSYSEIAASALSHMFGRETALYVSGLEWTKIESCVKWMKPFFEELIENSKFEENQIGLDDPNKVTRNSYMRQNYAISMELYTKAIARKQMSDYEYDNRGC